MWLAGGVEEPQERGGMGQSAGMGFVVGRDVCGDAVHSDGCVVPGLQSTCVTACPQVHAHLFCTNCVWMTSYALTDALKASEKERTGKRKMYVCDDLFHENPLPLVRKTRVENPLTSTKKSKLIPSKFHQQQIAQILLCRGTRRRCLLRWITCVMNCNFKKKKSKSAPTRTNACSDSWPGPERHRLVTLLQVRASQRNKCSTNCGCRNASEVETS